MSDKLAFPLDHLALRGKADDVALVVKRQSITYKELNLRIGQLATFLTDQSLMPGDRVATWLAKTEIACLMPLAAARAGLVHVPINPVLKRAQAGHILADSGARLLITNGGRAKSLEPEDMPEICALHDEKAVLELIHSDIASMEPSSDKTDVDALVAILYTSGSTGRPKGVMLSHANLTLGALSVAEYLKLRNDDRTLCVLPLSFDYGQNQLLSTWVAGGCAIPLDYLTARDVTNACTREQITTLAAVPPLWVQLVEQEWTEEASASMRRLTNSGGALTPSLVKSLRAIFRATDIYAMYGLTEAFRSTYLDPDMINENPTSMGTAIPFAEIMVIAENGEIAAAGQDGELVHAGPLVAQGYWQDAKRTAERFKPAPEASRYGGLAVWSGDTVRQEADGLLYFVGRDDAMIKTSGNRVSPSEVEEAAVESGVAAEAVALGMPDERLGHAVILFARAVDDSDLDAQEIALRDHLKHELPNFMQPRDIVWVREFPKNPNGKLDRAGLLESMSL